MAPTNYQPVSHDEERLLSSSHNSSDNGIPCEKWPGATIGPDDNAPTSTVQRWLRCLKKNWAWVGHVVLLSISAFLFTSSFCRQKYSPTNLDCSNQLSAWCRGPLPLLPPSHNPYQATGLLSEEDLLTRFHPVAPAQASVTYETVKFDLPMVPTGPYVGKGPDVDAAWEAITDCKQTPVAWPLAANPNTNSVIMSQYPTS